MRTKILYATFDTGPDSRNSVRITRLRPPRKQEPRCHDYFPHSGNAGGLNRSVQHLLAVYLPEFEIPKFFLDADLSAALPHRARLVNALTSLFV